MLTEIVYQLPELEVSILSSVISAVGSAVGGLGTIFGAKENRRAVKDTNTANMEIAKYQNEWNLEQWHRENKYNSPAAQMQRLKAAGINPNLAFSNGNMTNVAASSPRAEGATMQAYTGNVQDANALIPSIVSGAKAVEEIAQSKLQTESANYNLDYLQTDIALRQQQILTEFAKRNGIHIDNYIKKEQSKYIGEQLKQTIDEVKSRISVNKANADLIKLNQTYTATQTEQLVQLINKTKQDLELGKIQIDLSKQDLRTKKLDNELREIGINPNDSSVYRMIGKALRNPDYLVELGSNLGKLISTTYNAFNGAITSSDYFQDIKDGLLEPNDRRILRNFRHINAERSKRGLPPLKLKDSFYKRLNSKVK